MHEHIGRRPGVGQTDRGVGGTTSNGNAATGPASNGKKRPFGTIVTSALDGIRTLLRQEIELARIEVSEALAVRAKGAALMVAAAVIGLFALAFIAAAGSAALDLVLPTWAAHLIVGGIFALMTWALLLAGRRAIKTAPSPERTQETLKEDARWAKRQIAR
jgi:hypothetical protein